MSNQPENEPAAVAIDGKTTLDRASQRPLGSRPVVSFVIPTMDEEPSLAKLHSEINRVCAEQQIEHEIIFVDDGSSDGSWRLIASLVTAYPGTIGIRFRRNFGKAAALEAGFAAARGEIILTMDADLQDDPKEIPSLPSQDG